MVVTVSALSPRTVSLNAALNAVASDEA